MNNAIDRNVLHKLIDSDEKKKKKQIAHHFCNYIELRLPYLRQKQQQIDMSIAIERQLEKMTRQIVALRTVSLLLALDRVCIGPISHLGKRQRFASPLGSSKHN